MFLQSFYVITKWQKKFLSIWQAAVTRSQTEKIDDFFRFNRKSVNIPRKNIGLRLGFPLFGSQWDIQIIISQVHE